MGRVQGKQLKMYNEMCMCSVVLFFVVVVFNLILSLQYPFWNALCRSMLLRFAN